jgi:hypothetical protein
MRAFISLRVFYKSKKVLFGFDIKYYIHKFSKKHKLQLFSYDNHLEFQLNIFYHTFKA